MSVDSMKQFITQGDFDYIFDAPMCDYTTLKIGGKADILVQPRSIEELTLIISKAKENNIDAFFIGNGSNLLVRDKGIRGIVVKFGSNFAKTTVEGEIITAQSGISLSKLACICADNSLSGFEFAAGIPGTLGGGIVMNAGAYKGELKDVVFSVTALTENGEIKTFNEDELDFSYRHSCFSHTKMLVLEAKLRLQKGDKNEIKAKIAELAQKRRTTQPLEYPSAGSAFKRPKDGFAAAMIDSCDLKGCTVGGAQISQKHAGFLINYQNATANDVTKLLHHVQEVVFSKYGTMLEPEIITIGEE